MFVLQSFLMLYYVCCCFLFCFLPIGCYSLFVDCVLFGYLVVWLLCALHCLLIVVCCSLVFICCFVVVVNGMLFVVC